MESQESPRRSRHQGTLLAGGLLACAGWMGLFYMVRNVVPHAGARWLFFVFLYLAITGSSIPLVHFLNIRFRGDYSPPPDWVSVRQSLWIGLYISICAWLQIPRVLSTAIAILLAMGIIVIELFLRLRERSLYGY